MEQNEPIFKLDKKYTPYLLKAIMPVMKNEFVTSGIYDISTYYISFENQVRETNGSKCYTIRFYAKEVTDENWMEMSAGSAGEVNVDIDVKTQEVIYIYGDR